MGLEPTTFELEVQRADPLRHGGMPRTGLYIYGISKNLKLIILYVVIIMKQILK